MTIDPTVGAVVLVLIGGMGGLLTKLVLGRIDNLQAILSRFMVDTNLNFGILNDKRESAAKQVENLRTEHDNCACRNGHQAVHGVR